MELVPVIQLRGPLRAAALAALWAVVKAFSVWFFVFRTDEYSDTYYFFLQVEKMHETGGGVSAIFPEYPTPAAWLLLIPDWLSDGSYQGYRFWFLVMVVVVDALFVAFLIARTSAIGVAGWVLLTTLSGRLALLRLDIVPAVLAGVALLLILRRRWVAAGPVIAAATAVKVWPLLLFPLALGRRGRRLAVTLSTGLTGLVLVVLSVADGGWSRLFSPLWYQGKRGLQIEAVAATPAMLARLTDPAFVVFHSPWNAYEVAGPTVPRLLRLADASAVAGLVVFALILIVWFRRGCPPAQAAWAGLFVVSVMIVTSHALSPQYLLWLAAPVAVMLGLAWRDALDADGAAHRAGATGLGVGETTAALGLIAVLQGLSLLVYPVYYDDLLWRNAVRPVAILAARNVVLVAATAWFASRALARKQPQPR
ncbi:glycosyltransferase family 87 protein [Nigerium massiliense]|uniref:glycosyltransferase family 87 protein n=1 Tax=Nigerium massiliense TaxID=1522317 RepID=UPI00058E814C|nr:glycosyltransferase family 87 protein [Nigerium massiliense]